MQTYFERENALMISTGFPAIAEHQQEDARVLTEFRQFRERAERGFIDFARAFVLT